MDLVRANSDTDIAKHVQNLDLLYNSPVVHGFANWQTRIQRTFGTGVTCVYLPADAFKEAVGIIYDDTDVVVIATGITGIVGAERFLAPLVDNLHGWETDGIKDDFKVAADAILFASPILADPGQRTVTLIGHSYGGATVAAINALLTPHYRLTKEVWTYGAPRAMSRAWDSQARDQRYVRVCLDGDPVPRLPPNFNDAPIWLPLQNLAFIRRCRLLTHQRYGLQLFSDGRLRPFDGQQGTEFDLPPRVADWLLGTEAFGSDRHSIGSYAGAISASAALVPPPAPLDSPPRAEPIPAVNAREERQRIETAARIRSVTVSADIPAAVRDVSGGTVLVTGERYRRQTRFGVRTVTYDGNVVAWVKGIREQKRLVRELNKTLRP